MKRHSIILSSALLSLALLTHRAVLPNSLITISPAPPVNASKDTATSRPRPQVQKAPMLSHAWDQYKRRFVQEDGRVIDYKDNGISTSEGQAYGLLRSVWSDDQGSFDRILRWADNNLNINVRSDHLYAWKWGPRDDGSWGIYDPNSASDADQLIAFALLEASQLWGSDTYLERARPLLEDIWSKQTHEVNGMRFLAGGDWTTQDGPLRVNPSYYFPFAYRAFDKVDSSRGWKRLIETSYLIFKECRSRVGLPTDWCLIDPNTGQADVPKSLYERSSDFGYDAFRVLWNLAADFLWYQEPRAHDALQRMDWLRRYWILRHELPATITVDGIPLVSHEYLGMYGAYLPALAILDPEQAELLHHQKIEPAHHDGLWGNPTDYYAQNWVWFGLFLFAEQHPPPNEAASPSHDR